MDNVDNPGSEQFCSVSFCTKPNNARVGRRDWALPEPPCVPSVPMKPNGAWAFPGGAYPLLCRRPRRRRRPGHARHKGGSDRRRPPRSRRGPSACANPDHAPRLAFLRARLARAGRRSVRLDRCASTRCATRLGLICLDRRRVGARCPAAQGPDGIRPSATARNSAPSGQLVGS